MCLQGASAVEQFLSETPDRGFRVFVVWEKVLASDWAAPGSSVLARIPDVRAVQFWDPDRKLSHVLGEERTRKPVWDWIGVYPNGAPLTAAPVYTGRPVVNVAGDARKALLEALSATSSTTAKAR